MSNTLLKELRVGNYVEYDGEIGIVREINHRNCRVHISKGNNPSVNWNSPRLKPIPLTPEILEKAGFGYDTTYIEGADNCFYVSKTGEVHIMDRRDENYSFVVKCNYLHQLQNLIWALTGEELNIEL